MLIDVEFQHQMKERHQNQPPLMQVQPTLVQEILHRLMIMLLPVVIMLQHQRQPKQLQLLRHNQMHRQRMMQIIMALMTVKKWHQTKMMPMVTVLMIDYNNSNKLQPHNNPLQVHRNRLLELKKRKAVQVVSLFLFFQHLSSLLILLICETIFISLPCII